MTARALLVGSQTYGLAGTNNDVALMASLLGERGFDCTSLVDGDATREGILDAARTLIASTAPDDAAVVYYSGHGGRLPVPGATPIGGRDHLQFIVPFDMEASGDTDFRGILADELSDLQRRLTERTDNVTTILDCCHAGSMSRDPDAVPKVVAREFPAAGAVARLRTVLEGSSPVVALDDSNRSAVRLVACDPQQSAYERSGALGSRHGVLTEHLALFLRELGDREVTWRVAADVVRQRVTTAVPQQRPDVEGPRDRLLFSAATRTLAGALPVVVRDGSIVIEAATLLGVAPGDVYALHTAFEEPVGSATVTKVVDGRAILELSRRSGSAATESIALAQPVRTSSARPVAVDVPAPLGGLVSARVERSQLVRVAAPGEPPVATVVERDGLVVLDAEGFLVDERAGGRDDAGAADAVAAAERVATAERVRSLTAGGDHEELVGKVAVELARHDAAGRRPLARSGARLHVGDRISLTVRNDAATGLHVGVLDVKTNYEVNPISWRGGDLLEPGASFTLGGAEGVALEWDGGVPRSDGERPESLVVVVSTSRVDFELFRTRERSRGAGSPSALEELLADIGTGSRGLNVPPPGAGHVVEVVDFFLRPDPRPG